MTVKELIKELKKYPPNMDVFLDERLTEFKYGLLNSVGSKEITFSENPDSEPLSSDRVIILSEDCVG